ncbi:hypothetical protein KBB96_15470 [Luteolibacter ambystomatis]|uniref:VanZ-like domain-containing protein n=1 Tax=Luteolibacter ambystomatis TaxID=2824561 RepID=A0A975IYL5_9BACT|nr:hypothetical protein [Luteolibacter ambystomatis]QUE50264.1 hypothetical protein KBB96_15470 [Luteolibacter ambystomatis]
MKRLLPKLLAALVLAMLTVLAWQFRFEHSGPLLTGPFKPGLPGWEWKSGKGREANPDETGAVTISRTKGDGDPAVLVEHVLGTLDDARFLHIEMDAKWDDVEQDGDVRWATARVILFGKHPDGTTTMPHDHGLISAYGSAPWHHEEAVFDLVPNGGEQRLSLEHWGVRGSLQLRNVEVSVVRQRAWFLPAATALLIAWVLWGTWWAAPAPGRWKWLRALLAGCTLVGATWFLVFPQPRFSARSLSGQFRLGTALPVVAPPKAPEPAPPQPVPPVAVVPAPAPPPVSPVVPPPVAPPAPPAIVPPTAPAPAPPSEKREDRFVDEAIRQLHDRFNFLHIVAFGAFGLALFGFARPGLWPITAVIAFASEALPNYQQHQAWDRGDIGDLLSDGAGLLLAALVVMAVRKRWRKRCSPTDDPASGDSTPGKALPG